MANYSRLFVCCAALLLGVQAANLVGRDIQRIRDSVDATGGVVKSLASAHPKNATSSVYFQQVFSKEAAGASETKIGQTTAKPSVPLAAHPTSIQAVNKTVNGGNLTSSETQNYYGYEPTGWIHGYVPTPLSHSLDAGIPVGINKRHVHYPPVPIDVINSDNDNEQNEDGDDYDNDDTDDSEDYDGDSGEDRQSSPQQGSDDGDGEERDDDDFDHSATFAIPKIDPNHTGCKTVYKEIQSGPGKVKSIDDDFDADFAFKRRRKRSAAAAAAATAAKGADPKRAATSASFVLARECHFSDEGKERSKLGHLQPSAARHQQAVPPTPTLTISHLAIPVGTPAAGPIPESAKPKVTTGESRFVPINADPWRAPMRRASRPPRPPGPMGGGFGERRGNFPMAPPRPFLSADDSAVKGFDYSPFNGDDANMQHFHKYPYPHYHIYYDRPGESILDENSASKLNSAQFGNRNEPTATPQSEARDSNGEDVDEGPEEDTYESPNSYFEYGNPNGNEQPENQDDDEDDGSDGNGGGENNDDGEGEGEAEDDGLAASEPQALKTRSRRGTRGRNGFVLPLPPTLTPSSASPADLPVGGKYGWAVQGPNFYKSGKFENGDGKKKPKKYSYNFYQREKPKDDIDDPLESDSNGFIKAKSGFAHLGPRRRSHTSAPRGQSTHRSTRIHHEPSQNSKATPTMNDDGDFVEKWGSGTFKEYKQEYDSDKDKKKKANQQNDDNGNDDGQYRGHDDDGQYRENGDDGQYHGHDNDGQHNAQDGSQEDGGNDGGHYQGDNGSHEDQGDQGDQGEQGDSADQDDHGEGDDEAWA